LIYSRILHEIPPMNTVIFDPASKLSPSIVTIVPPDWGPKAGLKPVITGSWNVNLQATRKNRWFSISFVFSFLSFSKRRNSLKLVPHIGTCQWIWPKTGVRLATAAPHCRWPLLANDWARWGKRPGWGSNSLGESTHRAHAPLGRCFGCRQTSGPGWRQTRSAPCRPPADPKAGGTGGEFTNNNNHEQPKTFLIASKAKFKLFNITMSDFQIRYIKTYVCDFRPRTHCRFLQPVTRCRWSTLFWSGALFAGRAPNTVETRFQI